MDNNNDKIIYTSVGQFSSVRPPFSKISVQPGERLLSLIGYDYWNMESSARHVAEKSENIIMELEKRIARLSLPTRNVESILPKLEEIKS